MQDPSEFHPRSTLIGFVVAALEILVLIPVCARLYPGPMAPGSAKLIESTVFMGVFAAIKLHLMTSHAIDPFGYGTAYSFALMILCVEVWFREDPELFNGSRGRGYPIYLFHRPGDPGTRAVVPLPGYTRIFAAWHAGGVCLCFWTHVLARGFPREAKADVALALGLLWFCWAAINQWRSVYGAAQFCQAGVLFHGLTGPGCGLMAAWMLRFWRDHRDAGNLSEAESVLLGTVAAFGGCTIAWLLTQERKEAVSEKAAAKTS